MLKLNKGGVKRIAAMSALLLAGCTTAAQEETKQTAENQETIRQLVRLVEQAHKDSLRTDTGFYWFLCILLVVAVLVILLICVQNYVSLERERMWHQRQMLGSYEAQWRTIPRKQQSVTIDCTTETQWRQVGTISRKQQSVAIDCTQYRQITGGIEIDDE